MTRRPNGDGHDSRVIPFRPRKPEPPRPTQWGMSLKLFAILFAAGALLALMLQGGLGVAELLTPFAFAAVVAGADFYRRRKGLA